LQLSLMRNIRQSIVEQRFPQFVQEFMNLRFPDGNYDQWAVNALASVNIALKPPSKDS
jgi:queuine tRNA-ribosyltransferase